MPCSAMPCRVVSCRVVPCRALACPVLPCRALPCRATLLSNRCPLDKYMWLLWTGWSTCHGLPLTPRGGPSLHASQHSAVAHHLKMHAASSTRAPFTVLLQVRGTWVCMLLGQTQGTDYRMREAGRGVGGQEHARRTLGVQLDSEHASQPTLILCTGCNQIVCQSREGYQG